MAPSPKTYLMKKLLLLLCLGLSLNAMAQGGQDMTPEQRLERVKGIYKTPLMEKAKIPEAQADKIVSIIAETQTKMMPLMRDQSLNPENRMKKLEELRAERDKKFRDIPLNDEQLKSVNTVIDEIRRNMQQNRAN